MTDCSVRFAVACDLMRENKVLWPPEKVVIQTLRQLFAIWERKRWKKGGKELIIPHFLAKKEG